MADAPAQPIVSPYDFRHPARVNRDQLRMLESLHDNFARWMGHSLSGAMRAVVDVNTAFVDQTTYSEFIQSLSNPACSYQFVLGPTRGRAILDIAMPLAFAFVDRVQGGKGAPHGPLARALTRVEMGTVARIVKHLVADLESSWESLLHVEISDIELETNPEFMQITAPSEIVILLAFEVKSTNASGLVSLCYPFFTLEPLLARLGRPQYEIPRRPAERDGLRAANRERLRPAEVPLRGELARGTIGVEGAGRVQPGDVLAMDTAVGEPSVIYVGDEPKFLGLPFAGPRGRRAAKVERVLDHGGAARLRQRDEPAPPAR